MMSAPSSCGTRRPAKRLQRDPDRAIVDRWVADLGSPSFARRSDATQQLRGLGMSAWPVVASALEKPAQLEVRRRLEELLEALRTQPEPALLRDLRAIQMLEMIGTAEARRVLTRVDESSQHGPRAEAARSALSRLNKREVVR